MIENKPYICNQCKKEIAFQDAYRESFEEYYCSACWNARPLKQMKPAVYVHGCEGGYENKTSYCCFKVIGETLKLKTIPDDPYYEDVIEVKFCPFCGYKDKETNGK